MKYFKYIILSSLVGFMLGSCTEDELGPVLQLNNRPAITAPAAGATFELTEANAGEVLPAFTWTAVDYGFPAGTAYKLEMDIAGNNFAAPVALGTINGLSLTGMTQAELNNILLAKDLEGEVPVDIDLRVIATVNPEVDALVSDVVTITVVPYSSTVVVPQLQVPGSYQGWDPANNTTIIFSPLSNGLYEGYLFMTPGDAKYKYTQGPSWDTNWGDNGDDGTLEPGGADIPINGEGVYKLNVDLNGLTHTRTLTTWGLIGSATANGWDSDQDMTFDPGTGIFSITADLAAGELKFRANDDWAINFGDDGNNKTLEYGGANIAIAEAGNYTIELQIVGVSKYKYTITKN